MEVKEKNAKEQKQGVLKRIAGPVVTAVHLDAHMYDVVKVGNEALMGEVIKIQGDSTIIQVYEDTSGIRPGEPVILPYLSIRWAISLSGVSRHRDSPTRRNGRSNLL